MRLTYMYMYTYAYLDFLSQCYHGDKQDDGGAYTVADVHRDATARKVDLLTIGRSAVQTVQRSLLAANIIIIFILQCTFWSRSLSSSHTGEDYVYT